MFDFDPLTGKKRKTDAEIRRQALTPAKKSKIKDAVGYVCEIPRCKSKPYEVHHIVPLSKGGRNIGSNLIVLCANHHRDAHDGKFTQAELKKIVQKRSKKVKSAIAAILRDRKRVETCARKKDPFEMDIPIINIPDPLDGGKKKKGGKKRKKKDGLGFDLF